MISDKLRTIINDYVFKTRYVFATDHLPYQEGSEQLFNIVIIEKSDTSPQIDFLLNYISKEKLHYRLLLPNCTAFIATIKGSEIPVGFCWALKAEEISIWHDKFCLAPGTGLLFNAYVIEKYRGRHIYKILQIAVHKYLFDINCRRVYTIVESSNLPSLKACFRLGLECVGKNYLIKFLKYNIFSIYRLGKELKIYYVFKNPKGNNI